MAGTKAGGILAAQTNKAKYGKDFYARIGQMGGKLGRTGGFYANRDRAREAGIIGGRVKNSGWKLSDETKAKMSASHKARWAERRAETFFVKDETIDNHIIEPFVKQPWFKGWIRRSK